MDYSLTFNNQRGDKVKRFVLYVMAINHKGETLGWVDVNSYKSSRRAEQGLRDICKDCKCTRKWKIKDKTDNTTSYF